MKKRFAVLCLTTAFIYAGRSVYWPFSDSPCPYLPIFSGYLKSEYWWDTRQIFGLRENEYLLYPLDVACDTSGQDTNATGQFNDSIIQSRVRADFSAPVIYNIKPKAVFEADFFGTPVTLPVFRPRHIYTTLSSGHLTVLAGHTWHPLFIEDCFPDTVSFNVGAPIEVYGRQSQLRIIFDYKGFEWFVAAMAQLETPSDGPVGAASQYLRNGMIPNLHMQMAYRFKQGSLVGAGVDFLHLVPRLVTNDNVYAQEYVDAGRAAVFGKLKYKDWVFKAKGIYAENGYDIEMLGGYGVTHIDPVTDHRNYTPTRAVAVWGDFSLRKRFEPGIFVGWTKNIGTSKPIIQMTGQENLLYTRASNIGTIVRVSPRARWYVDPCVIACEFEYTRATYGTINNFARPCDTHPTVNIRVLGAVYYTF